MNLGTSVLLVGGEEDRQFFESLRRRIARYDKSGLLEGCMVVPVGSDARFGPWLKLLSSRRESEGRPFRYLVAADGAAAAEMRESFREASLFIRQQVLEAMGRLIAAQQAKDSRAWRSAVDRVNSAAQQKDFPLHFLRVDLAESMLDRAGDELLEQVAGRLECDRTPDRAEIMRRLGARSYGGKSGLKDAHIWGFIGDMIQPEELTANVRQCIARWFAYAAGEVRVRDILNDWSAQSLSVA